MVLKCLSFSLMSCYILYLSDSLESDEEEDAPIGIMGNGKFCIMSWYASYNLGSKYLKYAY